MTAQNAACRAVASKLGCSHDTLRSWCSQAARDAGERSGPSSEETARIKELEREVKELRTANEILKKGETIFRHWSEDNGRTHILSGRSSTARSASEGRRPPPVRGPARTLSSKSIARSMGASQCCAIGPSDNGGPICRVLSIASTTFHRHAAIARNPELASERARQDKEDFEEIRRVHDKSRGRYGARKVFAVALGGGAYQWRNHWQLPNAWRRDGSPSASARQARHCALNRGTVDERERIARDTRGKTKTTIPDPAQPCPDD